MKYSEHFTENNTRGRHHVVGRFLSMDIGQLLFYSALIIWLAYEILYSSFYGLSIDFMRLYIYVGVTVLLICSELFSGHYTALNIIALAGILLLLVLFQHSSMIVKGYALVFLYCARNYDFKLIAKICLITLSLSVAIVIVSAFAGIITNYVLYGERTRVFMGFRYALYPARYVFEITCLAAYCLKDRFNITACLVLFALNYIVYYFSDSRLSFYFSVISIITFYVVRKRENILAKRHFVGVFLALSYIIAAVVSIYVTYNYDPVIQWMSNLSSIFGNRLAYGKQAIDLYGITLFGQPIHMNGAGLDLYGLRDTMDAYFHIDCLYVQILVGLGIVYLVTYVSLFTAASWALWKRGEVILVLILAFTAYHGMIDDLSMRLNYNVFFLSAAILFSSPWQFGETINKSTIEIEKTHPIGLNHPSPTRLIEQSSNTKASTTHKSYVREANDQLVIGHS